MRSNRCAAICASRLVRDTVGTDAITRSRASISFVPACTTPISCPSGISARAAAAGCVMSSSR
uniref:Uncharacterized protein n=1 Tax=uncultured marine virus TaxID=186617 RepID=A0A0F7L588_9VIRU|nr:hypothetical protein [uncultured marine virus]